MKKIFFLLLTALGWLVSGAQWRTNFQGTDMNNPITGMSLYTPSTGYVASHKWVGFTTDSGRTFTRRYVSIGNVHYGLRNVNLTFGFTIEGVKAFSADTLLVYGDYGFEPSILYSTNGGSTWKVVYHKNIPFNFVYLVNAVYDMVFPGNGSTGFAIQGDEILRSTDRGRSWSVVSAFPNQRMFKLSFPTASVGYAAGKERILKSSNGGANWTVINSSLNNIDAIASPDPSQVFATAGGYHYYSSNGGSAFTQTNTEAGRLFAADLHYVNDSTGYAAAGYEVYQTRNRGRSWELMPGSNGFSYLGYGYGGLYFYNDQQGYAMGENEYTAITSNGGGTSLPKAVFEYDASNTCATNTVLLKNQSHSGYSYRWLRNGTQFATTYDASYTVSGASDVIQLIVTKNGLSDTMTTNIAANAAAGALTLNVAPVRDTVCSNTYVQFEIRNSGTDVQYQVGRTCCGYSLPVYGNGGTLVVSAWANSNEDTTAIFTIHAYRNGPCGVQTAQTQRPVRIILSSPPVTAVSDTICKQNTFFITVPNSRVGYKYWSDSSFAKVAGTGGAIQLPTRAQMATQVYNHDFDNIISTNTFGVWVQHNMGCGSGFPVTQLNITGRNTLAGFNTISHEMLTGAPLAFEDKSKQAASYVWTFSNGASATSSTQRFPNPSFLTTGIHLVQQKTITREGCVDSANRYIEIFSSGQVNSSVLCTLTANSQAVDSIRRRNFFVSRAFYEDEYGNRVVAGGYTDMRWPNGFYPRGYEGMFAARFSQTGQLQWYLETPTGEDYWTYNRNSHAIIEQAISDRQGYTYLLGHSLNKLAIKDSLNSFSIPRAGAFLIKVSPLGRIVWVKPFYHRDGSGLNTPQDYTGGSLLRGRNDDIYVVTQRKPGSWDFMAGDNFISGFSENRAGLIFHFDREGNLLRQKTYPTTYNNMRRFETYTSDSYDRLPPATWDSSGKLVIYGQLDPSQISGNSIDGTPITFNTATIKSALLFVDTTSLQVVNVKPLYTLTPNGAATVDAESYATDAAGNYYVSYSLKVLFPRSTQSYQFDTTKYKSFVVAFDANGNTRWKKQLEGLRPLNLLAYDQELKMYGHNYNLAGFSNGAMNFSSNASPTTLNVKKLTMVTDSGSYTGQGKVGLGSIDNVVASLSAATGNLLHMVSLGSDKEEETGTMRRGFGDQVWATGTSGLNLRNVLNFTDTASTLQTYKLATGTNCSSTYAAQPAFLKIDNIRNRTTCTEDTLMVYWSSFGVGQVNLSYSTNGGGTYTSLATGLDAATGRYALRAITAGLNGRVQFRLQSTTGSLTDTSTQVIYRMPAAAYPTGRVALCPYDTAVTLTAAPGTGYTYSWSTGDTTRVLRIQNFYREPFYDNIFFRSQYTLNTRTPEGCVRTERIILDTVPHYGWGGVPAIAANTGGDSLVSNLCGLPHVWYRDGVEITGQTGCRIKPTVPGVYQAATRHPSSGCTTWKGNSITFTGPVTSVNSLPPDAESINLLPNPAHEQAFVRLRLRKTAMVQLSVVDVGGRVVRQTAAQKVTAGTEVSLRLNTQGVMQGQYFVRIQINGVVTYRKLVIL